MLPKLVRDKIPEIITQNQQKPDYYIANREEYRERLFNKMREELEEFIENPCVEEAADMYEVWLAIIRHWGMIPIDVVSCANYKRIERGGFRDGVILKNVEEK